MTTLNELRDRMRRAADRTEHPLVKATFLGSIVMLNEFEAAHPHMVDLDTVTVDEMRRCGYSVHLSRPQDDAGEVAL